MSADQDLDLAERKVVHLMSSSGLSVRRESIPRLTICWARGQAFAKVSRTWTLTR